MPNTDTYKKIEAVLFLKDSEAAEKLTPYENERRKRWMYCVQKKMDDPLMPDKTLVEELMAGFAGVFTGVGKTTAYRDLAAINKLVGGIQLAAKNWYRYMIIEGSKAAYEVAKSTKDAKGMAAALDKIGKYTMADKPDNDFDWSQMVPIDMKPAADADLLENVEPIENVDDRRKKLRELFKTDMKRNAVDVEPEKE